MAVDDDHDELGPDETEAAEAAEATEATEATDATDATDAGDVTGAVESAETKNGAEGSAAAPKRASAGGSGSVRQRRKASIWSRLYHGDTHIDFIGRTKKWFIISAVVIAAGLLSLAVRGLNFGIEFEGGVVWEAPITNTTVTQARDVLEPLGLGDAKITILSSDQGDRLQVQGEPISNPEEQRAFEEKVSEALAKLTRANIDDVSVNSVGPTWGGEISRKAIRALVFFLIAITLYITFRFEFKMAVPTLLALIHDILVTVGIYSIAGFVVTPETVIAVLTILGYSIYDGIVVFDKVDENTRLVTASGRMSYGQMVNLSLNQTLMRSLNTSITALLPISSLLIIGSFILGASTLENFALALLVGLASGAYSSIFIASPALVLLKEREPRFRDLKRRLETRTERRPGGADVTGSMSPAEAAVALVGGEEAEAGKGGKAGDGVELAKDGAGAGGRTRVGAGVASGARLPSTPIPPRPRKRKKR